MRTSGLHLLSASVVCIMSVPVVASGVCLWFVASFVVSVCGLSFVLVNGACSSCLLYLRVVCSCCLDLALVYTAGAMEEQGIWEGMGLHLNLITTTKYMGLAGTFMVVPDFLRFYDAGLGA